MRDQELPLDFELDAFGNNVELQRISDCNDGECQGFMFCVTADFPNERTVNLDAVNTEALLVAEVRVHAPAGPAGAHQNAERGTGRSLANKGSYGLLQKRAHRITVPLSEAYSFICQRTGERRRKSS